jgi:two-component system sensor histidine kinase UhpB
MADPSIVVMWFGGVMFKHEEVERALEEGRIQLAREMHDTVIQPLTTLVTSLEAQKYRPLSPGQVEAYLDAWQELAREALVCLRQTLAGLRDHPHTQMGFVSAAQYYLIPALRAEGHRVIFDHRDWPDELPIEYVSNLYLILREALTNVKKHARASEVTILLRGGDQLTITIVDNGVGFAPAITRPASTPRGARFGLAGLRERVAALDGTIRLESAPGQGTRIEIAVPRPVPAEDAGVCPPAMGKVVVGRPQ